MDNKEYNIFICYRGKNESGLLAQQIYTTLYYYKNSNDQPIFSPFFAPRCIPKGVDFYLEEKKALSQIKIMLLVLNNGFFDKCTEDDDQVYFEISSAFSRQDVRFITVNMNGYSIHSDNVVKEVLSPEQIITLQHVNSVNYYSIYDFDPEKELISTLESLIVDKENTQLYDTLNSIQKKYNVQEPIIKLVSKALLDNREGRRSVQTTILQSPEIYRNQFLLCMMNLLDFPNEIVRGEAYYCLGELSMDSNVNVDEAFLCNGLVDVSDFVRACCANVLHKYIPLTDETVCKLKNELERISMMELYDELPLYTKKLKYYAIKTINEDETWKKCQN